MKTGHVYLAVFLAITFDYAAGRSAAVEELEACYDTYYGEDRCVDNVNLLACLEKITPDEDVKVEVKDQISFLEQGLKSCPGFKTREKCRDSETLICKDSFYSKQSRGDKSICNELQQVRDCLEKRLNDSCIEEVVREEMYEVDDLDKDCISGNFNGGPCGDATILACAVPVYADYEIRGDEVGYKCKSEDVAKSLKCLSDLQTTCKTHSNLYIVGSEMKELKRSCPSPQ